MFGNNSFKCLLCFLNKFFIMAYLFPRFHYACAFNRRNVLGLKNIVKSVFSTLMFGVLIWMKRLFFSPIIYFAAVR